MPENVAVEPKRVTYYKQVPEVLLPSLGNRTVSGVFDCWEGKAGESSLGQCLELIGKPSDLVGSPVQAVRSMLDALSNSRMAQIWVPGQLRLNADVTARVRTQVFDTRENRLVWTGNVSDRERVLRQGLKALNDRFGTVLGKQRMLVAAGRLNIESLVRENEGDKLNIAGVCWGLENEAGENVLRPQFLTLPFTFVNLPVVRG